MRMANEEEKVSSPAVSITHQGARLFDKVYYVRPEMSGLYGQEIDRGCSFSVKTTDMVINIAE